ncbi:Protein of uncharacterised function (DUF1367) [Actinobacillus ureae]|uniref:DUF1367 family protein n=1 Tax=Actinobacillus ureae TaxID=723 RepID=UPI000E118142|nr:DUF1367 family protein [Actinobacillus ureae]SUT85398.1 Protein of uncharacterised function (DUF1367) [Actinobacillus ureae]SUU42505.1 Protein of uncharacterised function (DUF1367) [Actinobacillus ureae]
MQLEMLKMAGGVLVPLNDEQAEALAKFKTGEQYQIEIKQARNPAFHRKVFAFFKFCFEHWSADKTEWQFQDEQAQFDTFRKNLTVLAGYFDKTYTIKGDVRIEPKSLAYGNMAQAEFERCYNSLINAAMKHIFKGCDDPQILDRLYAFFY